MFTGEIQRSKSKTPLYVGLGFALTVVLVVLLVPMPHPLDTTYALVPASVVDVVSPREGVVTEVLMTDGSMVARGTVLLKFDVTAAEKALPDAEAKLAALEEKRSGGGKVTPAQKAALAKAEGGLKKAQAALEKATKSKKAPAIAAATKGVETAQAALDTARDAVGPSGEQLETAIIEQQAKVLALKGDIASGSLTSPGSGLLTLKLDKGAALTRDQKLGLVEEVSKLRAEVKVPEGEVVKKGMGLELEVGGAKRRLTIDGPAAGGVVKLEVDNQKGELKAGTTGKAVIEGEQRSLLSGL